MTGRPTLSVVVPAYNEARFIGALLQKVVALDLSRVGLDREVIVVDDCSTDRTADIARSFPNVDVFSRESNGGKGRAVRDGLDRATGEFVIIQDADLEYEPADYLPMLECMLESGADAVYGSRYLPLPGRGALANAARAKHPDQSWKAYLGGQSLSLVAAVFTGSYLTDTVTALKLFRRDTIMPLRLETTGFELDHEITAKILARGADLREVPIRYFPRSREEGKKIGARDWFRAVRTFAQYGRRRGDASRTEGQPSAGSSTVQSR